MAQHLDKHVIKTLKPNAEKYQSLHDMT
jgi:hypothetical protein